MFPPRAKIVGDNPGGACGGRRVYTYESDSLINNEIFHKASLTAEILDYETWLHGGGQVKDRTLVTILITQAEKLQRFYDEWKMYLKTCRPTPGGGGLPKII